MRLFFNNPFLTDKEIEVNSRHQNFAENWGTRTRSDVDIRHDQRIFEMFENLSTRWSSETKEFATARSTMGRKWRKAGDLAVRSFSSFFWRSRYTIAGQQASAFSHPQFSQIPYKAHSQYSFDGNSSFR